MLIFVMVLLMVLLQLPAPLLVRILATCAASRDSPEALAIAVAVALFRSSHALNNYAMASMYSPVALAIAASTRCFLLFLPRSRCFDRGVCALKLRGNCSSPKPKVLATTVDLIF